MQRQDGQGGYQTFRVLWQWEVTTAVHPCNCPTLWVTIGILQQGYPPYHHMQWQQGVKMGHSKGMHSWEYHPDQMIPHRGVGARSLRRFCEEP